MDANVYDESVRELLKPKFKGKKSIPSRVKPNYPDSAEREYVRLLNGYMGLYLKVLKENLSEIENMYSDALEEVEMMRMDSKSHPTVLGFSQRFSIMIRKMEKELAERCENYDLETFMEKVAKRANNQNIREWKRLVKDTFGVDLNGHYYTKGTFNDLLERWIDDNVSYVKSIPQDNLTELREIIFNAYQDGLSVTKLKNQIAKRFGVSKNKAKMLARDQMGSLTCQIQRMQQEKAGCNKYRWHTRNDSRVRKCHRSFNNRVFDWNNPPEIWYETKAGRVYTGRRCHPGQDYCCRCTAIPVFQAETLSLPLGKEEENNEQRY